MASGARDGSPRRRRHSRIASQDDSMLGSALSVRNIWLEDGFHVLINARQDISRHLAAKLLRRQAI